MVDSGGNAGSGALLSFSGRINRGTFWKINLTAVVLIVLLGVGAAILIPQIAPAMKGAGESGGIVFTILLFAVYGLAIWISLATAAKRWHDLDKSAWFVLLNIIPLVGFLAFLYVGCVPGTEGQNRFGDVPTG